MTCTRRELPHWDEGTVAILSTGGGPPHAIPVSTAVRAGPQRILVALARGRESLARLRVDPRVAFTILARDDVAITAHATATVVADPLRGIEGVAAVALAVERVQDHGQPRFAIDDGVRWHWTDAEGQARDAEVRSALSRFATS